MKKKSLQEPCRRIADVKALRQIGSFRKRKEVSEAEAKQEGTDTFWKSPQVSKLQNYR